MYFLNYFNENVQEIKLIDKTKSSLMKFINFFFLITNSFKITNIKDFLTRYGTTIGNKIYDHPKWEWSDSPSPHQLHELTHVAQWNFLYALGYIFSSKKRAYYESICFQTEMLFRLAYRSDNFLNERARLLTGYGIKFEDALQMLRDRRSEIEQNNVHPAARKVFEAWKQWKNLTKEEV